MPAPAIHIDRIQLDLRGVSPAVAREALASLGPALREALAGRISTRQPATSAQIAHIAPGPVRVPASVTAAGLRNAVAGQLASAIAAQLTPSSPT